MRTVSRQGRAFLYAHEGVVLRAYRDAVGVLTIGAGLTSASGVITVKPGMTITAAENDRLVDLALSRNYVPRVIKAIGEEANQNAIDGAASFDWNTGAILKASWVKAFLAGNSADTTKRLALWNKGGGKVLPGLTRRRAEEAAMILYGKYPPAVKADAVPARRFAAFVVAVTPTEVKAIREGFASIGYDPGTATGKIRRTSVEAFQADYDLTVDGRIGRATLSTLQRELDARAKAKTGAATTGVATPAAAGAGEAAPSVIDPSTVPEGAALWLAGGVLAIGVLYCLWLAWRYRDIVAVRLAGRFPKLASLLRSF